MPETGTAAARTPDLFGNAGHPVLAATSRDVADGEALLRLVVCGGPAAPRRRLLEHAHPAAALAAGASLWRACGLSDAQVARLRAPDELEHARDWLAGESHHLLGWHDRDYPPLLRCSPNPPLVLFVAGDPALLLRPAVAIVGSRSPTPAGRENAAAFACALGTAGLLVASGLAAGVDTAAHHSALSTAAGTIAVLGTGPDVAYPRNNIDLHRKIADTGAIVSEHLPGTGPRKEHFPSRNRILAGLTLGTLVIEAAHRSGALITARLAAESGREVMALPGSIHNPLARGCHRLIRDGAALIERPQDVIEFLAPAVADMAADLRQRLVAPSSDGRGGTDRREHLPGNHAPESINREPPLPIDGPTTTPSSDTDHHTLWCALGHDPSGMDQLVERTGLTPARLSSMLLIMELEGRVAAQHGRYFRNR